MSLSVSEISFYQLSLKIIGATPNPSLSGGHLFCTIRFERPPHCRTLPLASPVSTPHHTLKKAVWNILFQFHISSDDKPIIEVFHKVARTEILVGRFELPLPELFGIFRSTSPFELSPVRSLLSDKVSLKIRHSVVKINRPQSSQPRNPIQPPPSSTMSQSNNVPLPRGWEMRRTPDGRPYYVDHNTRTTHWERPVVYDPRNVSPDFNYLIQKPADGLAMIRRTLPPGWEVLLNPRPGLQYYYLNHNDRSSTWDYPALPPLWEYKFNDVGTIYFVDHSTQTTTWDDPRVPAAAISNAGFDSKTLSKRIDTFFQTKGIVSNNQHREPIIVVHRDHILDSSVIAVNKLRREDIERKLVVKFHGEDGLDFGGVARGSAPLRNKLLDKDYAYFRDLESESDHLGHAIDLTHIRSLDDDDDSRQFYSFFGRVLGLCLRNRITIDVCFPLHIYKHLLGAEVTPEDLKSFDPGLYNSYQLMRNPEVLEHVEYNFVQTVKDDLTNEVYDVDLIENGSEILVTLENVDLFIQRASEYLLTERYGQKLQYLRDGFNFVTPINIVKSFFGPHELESIIAGNDISIEDWQANTVYIDCNANHPSVRLFWAYMSQGDFALRSQVLKFVTGLTRPPFGGFARLFGYGRLEPFKIQLVNATPPAIPFPSASTCHNRLHLPAFQDMETLAAKFEVSLQNTSFQRE
ncbi:hypothetical protein H696_04757 [Fonticula alba]|uniref:HECT-type E3 ubiquitin transferase n=1 Tax=Fonticula alba TaxID=691883 RepID=A0A058Z3K3_FONAL|nr:hypothetical protein H696_04757 [Fonticula alba]KCV68463.1 hypothetical protein H696_04757 [Fonticula alba]|eukprot:XP_009496895.1 hypothetical protein H696_04757 [Fonticula alba]